MNKETLICIDCGKELTKWAYWHGNGEEPYCFECWELLPGLDDEEDDDEND